MKQILRTTVLSGITSLVCLTPLWAQVFINEIHYDNDGADAGEAVEVAGPAGTDLTGWQLSFYNGNGGAVYDTQELSGTLADQDDGVGFLAIMVPGIQNGAPDGIALVDAAGQVVEFLSYEGELTATDGPAAGLNSTDIGVSETGTTPVGFSLQRTGNGTQASDFTWSAPVANTFGAVNTGQAFGEGGGENPDVGTIAIAEVRDLPEGSVVQVEGVLTVSDQLGGPAYLQDATGGIAIFDSDVHGDGAFAVGDQLVLTGTLGSFNEQQQLGEVDPTTIQRVSPATLTVAPRLVTLAELGSYEGELVTVETVTFPAPGALLPTNGNLTVSDASGTAELRIDGDVADLAGAAQPDVCSVTGVVGSFRGTPQLLPRVGADLPCATEFVPPRDTSSVPREATLDVVTWNIEWFGNTGNGPSPEETQRDNARGVIEALDADVYAFQEISDDALLAQIAEALPDYELLVQTDFVSQPPNTPGVSQKLAFLYRSSVIRPVRTEGLLADLHPLYNGGDDSQLPDYPVEDRSRFYASGRLPYLLEADVTLNGTTERVSFINLHARANGSSDPEERYAMRRYDVEVLKDYIDTQLTNSAVVLLGDYNDDVDETVADISTTTSSYVAYVEDDQATSTDAQFYEVVTAPLSAAGLRSFVFRDNMIDHISVTDELTDRVLVGSATVHSEFLDDDYASTTSDHLPVSARFLLSEPTTTTPPITTDLPPRRPAIALSVYPVPVRNVLNVRVTTRQPDLVTLRILDGYGRRVYTQQTLVRTGEQQLRLDFNTRWLPPGVYLLTGQGRVHTYEPVRFVVE